VHVVGLRGFAAELPAPGVENNQADVTAES